MMLADEDGDDDDGDDNLTRISDIALYTMSLVSVSESIGNLTSLTYLDLHDN